MTPYEPNKKRLSRRDVCPYPRQRTQSVCSASCFDCSDVCDQERCRGKCRPCSDAHAADGAFRVRVIDPATGAGLAGAVFELRRGAHAGFCMQTCRTENIPLCRPNRRTVTR